MYQDSLIYNWPNDNQILFQLRTMDFQAEKGLFTKKKSNPSSNQKCKQSLINL